MKGFGDTWKTPKGELYHIEKLWETATPLGQGYSPGNEERPHLHLDQPLRREEDSRLRHHGRPLQRRDA